MVFQQAVGQHMLAVVVVSHVLTLELAVRYGWISSVAIRRAVTRNSGRKAHSPVGDFDLAYEALQVSDQRTISGKPPRLAGLVQTVQITFVPYLCSASVKVAANKDS